MDEDSCVSTPQRMAGRGLTSDALLHTPVRSARKRRAPFRRLCRSTTIPRALITEAVAVKFDRSRSTSNERDAVSPKRLCNTPTTPGRCLESAWDSCLATASNCNLGIFDTGQLKETVLASDCTHKVSCSSSPLVSPTPYEFSCNGSSALHDIPRESFSTPPPRYPGRPPLDVDPTLTACDAQGAHTTQSSALPQDHASFRLLANNVQTPPLKHARTQSPGALSSPYPPKLAQSNTPCHMCLPYCISTFPANAVCNNATPLVSSASETPSGIIPPTSRCPSYKDKFDGTCSPSASETPSRTSLYHSFSFPCTPPHTSSAVDLLGTPQAPLRATRARYTLLRGILTGNPEEVERALQAGEDPNDPLRLPAWVTGSVESMLPVLIASRLGHAQVMKTLLAGGAVINSVNCEGQNALHLLFTRSKPENGSGESVLRTVTYEPLSLPGALSDFGQFLQTVTSDSCLPEKGATPQCASAHCSSSTVGDATDVESPISGFVIPSLHGIRGACGYPPAGRRFPNETDILMCGDILLREGIDCTRKDAKGKTPLQYALDVYGLPVDHPFIAQLKSAASRASYVTSNEEAMEQRRSQR